MNKLITEGLDKEGIHDALVDCRNQLKELNHYLGILLGPEKIAAATDFIPASVIQKAVQALCRKVVQQGLSKPEFRVSRAGEILPDTGELFDFRDFDATGLGSQVKLGDVVTLEFRKDDEIAGDIQYDTKTNKARLEFEGQLKSANASIDTTQFRGWISPSGDWFPMEENQTHSDEILDTHGFADPSKEEDDEVNDAWKNALEAGWIATGNGMELDPKVSAVSGTRKILTDKNHPATRRLRKLMGDAWPHETFDSSVMDNADVKTFVKFGTFKLVHPHATAATKEEIQKQYAKTTSFLHFPVMIAGNPDHHITVKFFGETPVSEQQVREALGTLDVTPPQPDEWEWDAIEFDTLKNGKVRVLELVQFPERLKALHDAMASLHTDDYPDYRPHITVSDELWERVRDELLDPSDLEVQVDPLVFEVRGERVATFAPVVEAKVWTHIEGPEGPLALYRNPTRAELNQLSQVQHGFGKEIRAFLDGKDWIVWDSYHAVHQQVYEKLKASNQIGDEPIPLVVYWGRGGKIDSVQVTDWARDTSFYHSPQLIETIQRHPAIERWHPSGPVPVYYFDEAIVGPWHELAP